MNHDTDRSSQQIQADIERRRGELDRTLTLLERQLQPRRLVDQGIDYLRDNGASEYLSNLGRATREQPLPLALVGVGLAWLMMTNGRTTNGYRVDGRFDANMGGRTDGRDMGDVMSDTAAEAGSRVGQAADAVRQRASELGDAMSHAMSQTRDAAQRTTQSLSGAADAARGRAAQLSDATVQGAQRLRSGYDHLVNEQPLALGAIGLAIGAVLAAAAPRTPQEDEWMGGASGRLAEAAKRVGKEKLQEVQKAVAETTERAGNESGRDGQADRPSEPERPAWASRQPRSDEAGMEMP